MRHDVPCDYLPLFWLFEPFARLLPVEVDLRSASIKTVRTLPRDGLGTEPPKGASDARTHDTDRRTPNGRPLRADEGVRAQRHDIGTNARAGAGADAAHAVKG